MTSFYFWLARFCFLAHLDALANWAANKYRARTGKGAFD